MLVLREPDHAASNLVWFLLAQTQRSGECRARGAIGDTVTGRDGGAMTMLGLETLLLGAMCLMLTWGWLSTQGPRLAPARGERGFRSTIR